MGTVMCIRSMYGNFKIMIQETKNLDEFRIITSLCIGRFNIVIMSTIYFLKILSTRH